MFQVAHEKHHAGPRLTSQRNCTDSLSVGRTGSLKNESTPGSLRYYWLRLQSGAIRLHQSARDRFQLCQTEASVSQKYGKESGSVTGYLELSQGNEKINISDIQHDPKALLTGTRNLFPGPGIIRVKEQSTWTWNASMGLHGTNGYIGLVDGSVTYSNKVGAVLRGEANRGNVIVSP